MESILRFVGVQFVRRIDGRLLRPNSNIAEFKAVNNVPRVQQASIASILPRYAFQDEDPFQPKGPVFFGRKAEESAIVRDRRSPD
jgi:hypothetical protein